MRYKVIFTMIFLLWGLVAMVMRREEACDAESKELLNEIVIIEGKVEILNHPDLGRTPASRTSIIFQRVDCGKCLIDARTDEKGNYRIDVGRGRYRVVKRGSIDGGSPTVDMLAPDQPRYVDAASLQYKGNRFDIRIVLPSR